MMARSYRKPIVKDKPKDKKEMRRRIRRVQKHHWKQGLDVPHFRTIVNGWDFCDWKTDFTMKGRRPETYDFKDYVWKTELQDFHFVLRAYGFHIGGRLHCLVYDPERLHCKKMVTKYSRK